MRVSRFEMIASYGVMGALPEYCSGLYAAPQLPNVGGPVASTADTSVKISRALFGAVASNRQPG